MIDKTAGAHKYGWRVWENKLTGPGLSAAPLRLSITDLTGALRKSHTRMTHTRKRAHRHTHTQSLNCAFETIVKPYSSPLLHYQHTEFMLSDMYQELSVIEECQPVHKIQYIRKKKKREREGKEWQKFSFSHHVKNILSRSRFPGGFGEGVAQRHFGGQGA